jgi:hypothetical protein
MNRHERRKAKATQPKRFMATHRQIGEMCDVFFAGVDASDDPDGRHGFVEMYANEKGRETVNAVFPSGFIDWEEGNLRPGLPYDVSLNVIDCANAMPDHRLPLEITGGKELDQGTPYALAYLLAEAARRQGARTAVHTQDGTIEFYLPEGSVQ